MALAQPESVDQQVQAAIAAGEYRGALELLTRTYLDTVFRYCWRVLHEDIHRAKDVTQQVFEEVCRGIAAYRGEASTRTWLLAIAHHQCLKEIAARARRGSILRMRQRDVAASAHASPPTAADAAILSEEWLTRLRWALGELKPEERSILIMRFGVGVPHELSAVEIAQILGISRPAAYRKLQEALVHLRRIMHDDAG